MPPHFIRLLGQAADEAEPAPARLFAAALLRADLERWLKELAQEARDAGHTWAELGMVLDVTRQAVHKRFSNPDGPKHWRYDREAPNPQLEPMTDDDATELLVSWLSDSSEDDIAKNWSALPEEMLDKLPDAIREKVRRALDRP